MVEQIKEIIKNISFDYCDTCEYKDCNYDEINAMCVVCSQSESFWKLSDIKAERIAKEILAVLEPDESEIPIEKWLESKGFVKSNHFGYVCWINPIKTIKVCVTDDGQFKWIYSKDIESVEWLHIPVIKSRRQLEWLLMALEEK